MSSQKGQTFIGISVTPNIGVEMVQVDKNTNTVVKYANKPLEYDISQRNIPDFPAFSAAVKELFDEFKISPNTNVVLTVPVVEFKFLDLPVITPDEGVKTAIESEVEQSYIFRRNDPDVRWVEMGAGQSKEFRRIAYTALQQETVLQIKDMFSEMGANLLAIEVSYASILKTLDYCKIEEIEKNVAWNVVLINQNSFSIINMQGSRLMDVAEFAVPVKSLTEEEIYDLLPARISEEVNNFPASSILIISKVDEVSAERLAPVVEFYGEKHFVENNKFAGADSRIMPVDYTVLPQYANQVSLEVIGSAIYFMKDYSIAFNFTEIKESIVDGELTYTIYIGRKPVDLSEALIKKVGLGLATVFGVIFFIVWLILSQVTSYCNNENTKMQTEKDSISKELEKLNATNSAKAAELNKIASISSGNEKELAYYGILGKYAPNTLWIKRFYTNNDGALGIAGSAMSVDDVRKFLVGISSLGESDIVLSKLKMNVDDPVYDFEITNAKFKSTSIDLSAQGNENSQSGANAQNSSGNAPSNMDNNPPVVPMDAPPSSVPAP